jgi:hypothetical protein
MDDFISEDDLLTFEGFLKYQAVDPAMLTPDELAMWRGFFDEAVRLRESSSKVGLMKLRQAPGEEKYGVALRDGSELWLTMWVRCSAKGEIFVMYPRRCRKSTRELSLGRNLSPQKLWQHGHTPDETAVDCDVQRE